MSPACRAARSHQLFNLPAAAVLRSLHDADYEKCCQHSFVSVGGAALLLILIPAFLATISTSYCTNLMDMFIYTSLNLFLLVTYVISLISVPVITICCASIGGYIIYYYGIIVGAVRNASRQGMTRHIHVPLVYADILPPNHTPPYRTLLHPIYIFHVTLIIPIILSSLFPILMPSLLYSSLLYSTPPPCLSLGVYIDAMNHVHRKHRHRQNITRNPNRTFWGEVKHSLLYSLVSMVDLLSWYHVLFSPAERYRLWTKRQVTKPPTPTLCLTLLSSRSLRCSTITTPH